MNLKFCLRMSLPGLSQEEFSKRLEELRKKVPTYTDEQIEIELSVILAGIGDTHTGIVNHYS